MPNSPVAAAAAGYRLSVESTLCCLSGPGVWLHVPWQRPCPRARTREWAPGTGFPRATACRPREASDAWAVGGPRSTGPLTSRPRSISDTTLSDATLSDMTQPARPALRADGRQSLSTTHYREPTLGYRLADTAATKARNAEPPVALTPGCISGISPDGEIAATPLCARRAGALAGRASSPDGRARRAGRGGGGPARASRRSARARASWRTRRTEGASLERTSSDRHWG
ncbi:hypothetical protein Poly30_33560 [Planctomycetes bacterium Poly30]|uniref:Uncharacterized protein n=1 Tax=Saltatorellus ferox TaxID=2528018 RepID=A0A518EUP6_9BACT|nr:hypothetical protein Poly30_33560 [Planctomycetes bacterium Poly30]